MPTLNDSLDQLRALAHWVERARETSLEEGVSTGYLVRIILIGRKL